MVSLRRYVAKRIRSYWYIAGPFMATPLLYLVTMSFLTTCDSPDGCGYDKVEAASRSFDLSIRDRRAVASKVQFSAVTTTTATKTNERRKTDKEALPADEVKEQSHLNPDATSLTSCLKSTYNRQFNTLRTGERPMFQVIKDSDSLVYSAFPEGESVRIIALRRQFNESKEYFCQMWYKGRDARYPVIMLVAKTEVKDIPRSQDTMYTGSHMLCNLPEEVPTTTLPFAVSITRSPCDQASNLLYVHNSTQLMTSQLMVCVPPIHHALDDFRFLVESIELKMMLGVERFVFYNYSMGDNLRKMLLYYKSQGIVDIVDWPMPLKVDDAAPEIYYFGQLAAENDCLYRYRHVAKYIIFQDIDEFFILQRNITNIPELIQTRLKANPKATSFMILNMFFPSMEARFRNKSMSEKEWEDTPVVLKQTYREFRPFPYNKKAKFIVMPTRVEMVGIHQVIEAEGVSDKVPQADALMFHFRPRGKSWKPQDGVQDRTLVIKYGTGLVKRLKRVWKRINNNINNNNNNSYDSS